MYRCSARSGIHGRELWKSDGTASGTVMVKDIYSGSLGSEIYDSVAVGSTLFFMADDGTNAALEADSHLMNGLNVCAGKVTNRAVAETFDLEYVHPREALALR